MFELFGCLGSCKYCLERIKEALLPDEVLLLKHLQTTVHEATTALPFLYQCGASSTLPHNCHTPMLPLQVLCANDLFQCIMYLSPSITALRKITSWLCSTNFILLTGSFSCSGLKALFQGPARIKQLLQANFAMNRCTRNFLQQELSDVFQVPKSKTSRKTHDFNTSFRKTKAFSAVLTMEFLTSLNQRVVRDVHSWPLNESTWEQQLVDGLQGSWNSICLNDTLPLWNCSRMVPIFRFQSWLFRRLGE